ncbi:uncharacterized protein [Watersipora subatra]|uniref:uncharacterized protein n=1 Tax=Watersipora subatra TaxID=2589382 RepID=UPI00355BC4EF
MKEAVLACDKTTSFDALTARKSNSRSQATKPEKSHNFLAHATDVDEVSLTNIHEESPALYCLFCDLHGSHNTTVCRKLSKLSNDEQQTFFSRERLCFKCLKPGHLMADCLEIVICQQRACDKRHPTCTHKYRKSKPASTNDKPKPKPPSARVNATQCESNTVDAEIRGAELNDIGSIPQKRTISLTTMIVPVYLSSAEDPNKEILTYALLDTMANTSIILDDICDTLGTHKTRKQLKISTVTTRRQVQWCNEILNLRVRAFNSCKSDAITIPKAYSQSSIPADRRHIPTPQTAGQWEHLKHLKRHLAPLQDCEIGLIIGYNCSAASLPLTTIWNKSNLALPYAVKTQLGWSIIGGQLASDSSYYIHRIETSELTKEEVIACLEDDLSVIHGTPRMSQHDLLFLKKMQTSIKQVDSLYTMPLPFKTAPTLPNNRDYALRRFKGLDLRLNSNPALKSKYFEFIQDIISKGEAEPVQDLKEAGWYIPHHGVTHPLKPGKLRVVFDCSATFRGHSLNQLLLQGPDLNNSLTGLLCRFRKDKVAVTCDIKRMFHQFRVDQPDRKYLRFLWYKPNSADIMDYQMNVHPFGAVSSPSCAIFGLKKLAEDNKRDFPQAAKFVQKNFYVDDGLVSVLTAEDAVSLMSETKEMMARGNLVLHKFLSNNEAVSNSLGYENPTNKVITPDLSTERALGLCWDITQDVFKFLKVDIKSCTRRGILSTIASVFDPLGFLTPFTLKGKLLLQSLCHDKVGWDEPLTSNQMTDWISWKESANDLISFKVPRCYLTPEFTNSYRAELHTFSDASTVAYGVCSYLRLLDNTTYKVAVSLIMGKSRVAPKKAVTIPRLELQAATLAVKVADFIKTELDYQNLTRYFWTDSKTVLGYINNEAKRFHVFVCNRVERIRDSTDPTDWRYVCTEENPADLASRGEEIQNIPSSWLNGPSFLNQPDFRPTPQSTIYTLNNEDPEIRKVFIHTTTTRILENRLVDNLEKWSSWIKITKIVSNIVIFITACQKTKLTDSSPQSKLIFNMIVKLVQQHYFANELLLLKGKARLPKSTTLSSLDPFLDKCGVIRVGGRLRDSLSCYEVRHPAILPGKSQVTKAFAYFKHVEAAHQGRATTANALRAAGVYLVGGGTKMLATMIRHCAKCTKLRGNPVGQKMSNLPQCRTEPEAPFTHTGVDVFGPFKVKDYRKECKRYGLLFTCMASRAVHLEVLEDMTTDCYINSLRSFLAIRGPVSVLYSDNGTNFVGASNEFGKTVKELSEPRIKEYLSTKQCSFSFSTPTASHMGGTWERMIRTVRNVLRGLLIESNTNRIDTSSLRTLLYECMYIVNSRPLTTTTLHSDQNFEPIPLTPNNLLTMKNKNLLPPPGSFTSPDLYSRKRWRRVQYLTEQFWSRWKLEYLQSLQKRQKWKNAKINLKPGDVVIVMDDELPRCNWQLGRVTEVQTNSDGYVRHATLQTAKNKLKRPVHKLILLHTTPDI